MGLVIVGELSGFSHGIVLKNLEKNLSSVGIKNRVNFLDGFSYKALLLKLYSSLLTVKKIITFPQP